MRCDVPFPGSNATVRLLWTFLQASFDMILTPLGSTPSLAMMKATLANPERVRFWFLPPPHESFYENAPEILLPLADATKLELGCSVFLTWGCSQCLGYSGAMWFTPWRGLHDLTQLSLVLVNWILMALAIAFEVCWPKNQSRERIWWGAIKLSWSSGRQQNIPWKRTRNNRV